MEVAEHFYTDDPRQGPPDAKTTLDGVDYFFLGNGLIQAAVQVCTSGQATPVGLLILHPERLGPKRRALTYDPKDGLAPTAVTIRAGARVFAPQTKALEAQWTDVGGVPAVRVAWQADDLRVEETFYCPDRCSPRLVRIIRARKSSPGTLHGAFRTGFQSEPLERPLELAGDALEEATLLYELRGSGDDQRVDVRWSDAAPDHADGAGYWGRCAALTCSSPTLEHLFRAARNQLPAAVAASGMTDGGIWQYNLEWARDQAFVAATLATLGAVDTAQTMFDRLLTKFVSDDGDCVDSGRRRAPAEVELDQNGYLLTSLETYVNWTGDVEVLRRHWPRIRALAEFPLRTVFRHAPSGLLHNRREFWERHAVHGIQDGMELTHQVYTALGLASAARLARLVSQPEPAQRWEQESQRIRKAMLGDARYGLIEDGRFIKRRGVNGAVQTMITPAAEAGLPGGVPLFGEGSHYLNPDTSTMLPIALEFVDPRGELARNTLADIEQLWNQRWDGGGYGRYHVSSEPDSPGPWPFPSLFVARAYFEAGEDDKVWRILNWLASAPGGRAGTWFEFYGPRPIPPYPQVGIIPWTWAEMTCFFIHHLLGVRPGYAGLVLRPSLLAGLDSVEARLRLRGHTLRVGMRRCRRGETPSCIVGSESYPYTPDRICLPMPSTDLDVQMVMPT
jgi:hypothetical protein